MKGGVIPSSTIPVPDLQDVPPIQGINRRMRMSRWQDNASPVMTDEDAKNWITETRRQFPNKSYQDIMEEMINAKSNILYARSETIQRNLNVIVSELRGFMQRGQQGGARGKRRTIKKRKQKKRTVKRKY